MIRVALVGLGRIADLHVPGYRRNPDACLHALCDRDPEVLQRRQAEWGVARGTTDYAELLADPTIDAVEILTPQLLHEPQVCAALAAGKHVAVQKPLTVDLDAADRMLRAAAASGKVFKVTENYVGYPPIVRARQLVQEGAIGRLVGVRLQFVSGTEGGWEVPAAAWQWRVAEARAGRGATTFDHGHHLWSTAWFLGGPVARVSGRIEAADGLMDCPAHFHWKYRDVQAIGGCDFFHGEGLRVPSHYYANDEWIELYGTTGLILVRRCTGRLREGPPLSLWDAAGWHHLEVPDDWQEGFTAATHNFVAAILGREPPLLDGPQAREVLRLSLALQKAARTGREVWLDELDSPVPAWTAWRCRRRERAAVPRPGLLERLGWGPDLVALAPRALSLTEQLVRDFDPTAAGSARARIGLILRGDGQPELQLGLVVEEGRAELLRTLPADARLTVTMRPGVWAAVLLKQKRIELAVLQGQVDFVGRAEEAVALRAAFHL
ncbi:MAG: Gfo/Idh/MocA family oxidoreductase [Myxococcota bacterium]|jgi:predicted dehydrogenase|nr:Gfo/Idh/MocA family oxidoreductase [Myxococcota bacterium]